MLPNIEGLPDELCLHILRFLSLRDLGSVSISCWRWRHLASDDVLWKRRCHKAWPHARRLVHEYHEALSQYGPAPYRRLWAWARESVDHWRSGRYSAKSYGQCYASVGILGLAACEKESVQAVVDTAAPTVAFVAPKCCCMPLLRADIPRAGGASPTAKQAAEFTPLHHHKHHLRHISANGEWLASVSSSKIRLLSVHGGQGGKADVDEGDSRVKQVPLATYTRANYDPAIDNDSMRGNVAGSRNFSTAILGKATLVAGTVDGYLCVFDVEKGAAGGEALLELGVTNRRAKYVMFDNINGVNNNSEQLLVAGYEQEPQCVNSEIAVWDTRQSLISPVLRWMVMGRLFGIHGSERRILFGTNDSFDPPSTLGLVDPRQPRVPMATAMIESVARFMVVNDMAQTLVCEDDRYVLSVWDLSPAVYQRGQVPRLYGLESPGRTGDAAGVACLSMTGCGRRLLGGTIDGELVEWEFGGPVG